ncbi:hypothetical protein POJ06DRAFT_259996 [Lipomyces tetrasporus]|uniref:Zn(2)-C6 fungal-type domain-containing protein n=1 Tax=Lipomyces tetrasporus TaxID=54092 RepID=A0AAD7VR25_9ASCO|nr:uncharacterized protein POJ06DRAFT_259996 [Lipomyces tetrasporus]KAJ8097765.1 hypothetical protein POJ06DRAFT_259996 [Lipomyces tetrasporus]
MLSKYCHGMTMMTVSSLDSNSTSLAENSSSRACDSCRSRKIKCDRKEPCLQCTLRDVVCVYSARKKRKRRICPEEADDDLNHAKVVEFETTTTATPQQNGHADAHLDQTTKGRLGAIEYHLEQLSSLLDQQQAAQETLSNHRRIVNPRLTLPTIDEISSANKTENASASLVAKVHDQLRHLGTSSLLSMSMDSRDRVMSNGDAHGERDRSFLRWSSELAEKTTVGLSEEVADSLAIDSHRPWLPNQRHGLELLDYFMDNVISIHPVLHISLAKAIRDTIYSPYFYSDKYFVQKLACASYMMIQSLQHAEFPYFKKVIDGIPIENLLFRNIFLILRDVRVLFVPSLLNIQVLFIAAISSKQIYNPGLCWTIISHASRHCLDLGLNRQSNGVLVNNRDASSGIDAGMVYGEDASAYSEQSRLFWSCFVVDKVMSLTFGRSPSFQTRDCSVPVPPQKPYSAADPETLGYWKYRKSIDIAFMYDAIYTRLYSAAAEAELASLGAEGSIERTRRRGDVVEKLHKEADMLLNNNLSWIKDVRNGGGSECHELADSLATEIHYVHCVCLTMIHRVHASVSAESREIYVRVSRQALQLFKQILDEQPNELQRQATTSWALVFQPFAPFFGVFNAIADNGSGVDLDEIDLSSLQCITWELQKLNKEASGSGVLRRLSGLANEFTDVATEIIGQRKGQLGHIRTDTIDATSAEYSALFGLSATGSQIAMPVTDNSNTSGSCDTESYSEAARQTTLPSWLEFLSDDITSGGVDWMDTDGLLENARSPPANDGEINVVADFLQSVSRQQ